MLIISKTRNLDCGDIHVSFFSGGGCVLYLEQF